VIENQLTQKMFEFLHWLGLEDLKLLDDLLRGRLLRPITLELSVHENRSCVGVFCCIIERILPRYMIFSCKFIQGFDDFLRCKGSYTLEGRNNFR